MFDLAIYNTHLSNKEGLFDVLISDGVIVEIRSCGESVESKESINAGGAVLSPGFVDCHTHLDKTGVMNAGESKSLKEAIVNFSRYVDRLSKDEYKQDIKRRARTTLTKAVLAGTTSMRTHLNVENDSALHAAEALNEIRDEMSSFIDITITSLPGFFDGPEAKKRRYELIDYMAENKLIDAIGGSPHHYPESVEMTRELFAQAVKHDLDVDLHIDEHDDPRIDTLMESGRLAKLHGYEGRVSCSHVTGLCRVNDELAAEAIALAKDANLHIITLPSCNLYLMARNDREPIPRGVTRIKEFLDAGVNISYASDNIRDPFRPIGNADMLEEGLITGQVAQMLTDSDLRIIHAMGTENPAKAMQLENYGLDVGKRADLVLLDAEDIMTAYRDRATRLAVIKNGRVVARNIHESILEKVADIN